MQATKADFSIWGRLNLKIRAGLFLSFILFSSLYSQDYFRFYAPPGGVYLNASFERAETVIVPITVEHEGLGVSSWFLTVSAGNSGTYLARDMDQGSYSLTYQIYKTPPPSTEVLKAPPDSLGIDNVISSGDFTSDAPTVERITYNLYFFLDAGQFSADGEYSDTVTVSLYQGDYGNSGTHVLSDTFDVGITGRMAELIDLYADKEPDNRFLDLTSDLSNKRIAQVHERSNSALGYEVTIRSRNLAADLSSTVPFMEQDAGEDRLEYSLKYDSVPVEGWSSGIALITDSSGITSPEWLTKELTLSYTGDPDLAHGEYEDILTLIITAK